MYGIVFIYFLERMHHEIVPFLFSIKEGEDYKQAEAALGDRKSVV